LPSQKQGRGRLIPMSQRLEAFHSDAKAMRR